MIAALLLISLQAAAATSAPSPSQADASAQVEVVGRRGAPVTGAEAARVVRGLAVATPAHDQLARWADPVCPKVEGLPEPYAGLMETRLREIAGAAGAPVDKPGCVTNALILVTADAERLKASLKANERLLLGRFEGPRQVDRFLKRRTPVVGWWTTDERDRSGAAASNAGAPDEPPINLHAAASHIQREITDVVHHAVVIVDTQATQGRSLAQVTDYVAMVLLAGDSPHAKVEAPSVLRLFQAPPPEGVERLKLTDWDRAYLHALYATAADRSASAQRSAMAHEMARELNGAGPARRP